jgi:hypothetical protein
VPFRSIKPVSEGVRSKLHFGRTYSFYLKLKKTKQTYFFNVSILAFKPMNKRTGMSVDLVRLNAIAKKAFKSKISLEDFVLNDLSKVVLQIKQELELAGSQLVSVHFDEVRGSGIHFEGKGVLFIRKDFATNPAGDLFQVASYFDQKNTLVRMNLKNLKQNISEQLFF